MILLIQSKEERFPHFSHPPSRWLIMIVLLDIRDFPLRVVHVHCLLKNQNCFLSKSASVFSSVCFKSHIYNMVYHFSGSCDFNPYLSSVFKYKVLFFIDICLAYEYCFDFWELSVVWQLNIKSLMLNFHNSKND